jgi:hypothetical protein
VSSKNVLRDVAKARAALRSEELLGILHYGLLAL